MFPPATLSGRAAAVDALRWQWLEWANIVRGQASETETTGFTEAAAVTAVGADPAARVIVLQSGGTGPFCAGASFDELTAINNAEQGQEFFSGFARVILAMIRAPKFVISRVHGKAAGGAVGLIAASDFSMAVTTASGSARSW